MKIGLMALVLTGALAGCGGRSQPMRATPESPRHSFMADALLISGFDADGDLRVTTAEVSTGVAREFARADSDRGGSVEPLEFQTWAHAALGPDSPPFRLDMDRNVDNVISAAEFEAEISARARGYDANSDQVLVRAELATTALRPQAFAPSQGPMGGQRRGP